MPPRYAYWTILIDNQPTAFRAGAKEDLLPTFNRLKEKNPSAVMMWFQNGKLWPSRVDAQEAMLARGELGRRGDARQGGGFRERHKVGARSSAPARERSERPEWKPKNFAAEGREPRRSSPASGGGPKTSDKLEWKPKGEFTPAPKRSERSDWKPKTSHLRQGSGGQARPRDLRTSRSERPDWKPKGSFDRDRKPEWKPRGKAVGANFPARRSFSEGGSSPRSERSDRREQLEWKPKGDHSRTPRPQDLKTSGPEKRKWIPKEEYKKSQGIEAKRDSKWRPGGEHRDPRQKYKDAKKAKWTKFKKTIRTKWEAKSKKKS